MHKKLWFRAKRYGWGWYPRTWQGWAILLMYVFAVFANAVYVGNHELSGSDFIRPFFAQTYILTVFLIIICSATGEKPYWRWGRPKEEMLDIVDSLGVPTGVPIAREVAHAKGLWHRTVQIYILNSKNEVLLQLRSETRVAYKSMWHLSAGGHIEAGQESLPTAARELEEELGLRIPSSDFHYIGTVLSKDYIDGGRVQDNEFNDVYIVRKDVDIAKLKMQASEVADVRWLPLSEFKKKLEEGDKDFVPSVSAEYLFCYLRDEELYAANKKQN